MYSMKVQIKVNQLKKYLFFILFFAFCIGTAIYFYFQYQNEKQKSPEYEISQTVEQVSKILLLPNEQPNLATVTQKELLGGQPFFKNAENGDKVLIYIQAGKAILYRPSEHKIIEVSAINPIDQNTQDNPLESVTQPINQTPEPTPAAVAQEPEDIQEKVELVLYNGSQTVGITNTVATNIENNFDWANIINRESANLQNYERTVIIDLTGNLQTTVSELAQLLNADVATEVPSDETVPEADILVIVGNNSPN